MNIINILKSFFAIQDSKFIIAGIIMLSVFLLIVYLLSIIVISFKKRKEAVNVSLPDINTYNKKNEIKKQFEEPEMLVVELIDTDDDIIKERPIDNEDLFITALSIETKKYIPKSNEILNMPQVGELNYEDIKAKRKKEKEKMMLNRLKEIAKADDKIQENFIDIDNGGAI